MDALTISNNPALQQQLAGFNSLRNLQNIGITGNGITAISGFNGGVLLNGSGSGSINISSNPRLQSIIGFAGANVRSLNIYTNAGLVAISGFNNGAFVAVNIGSNDAMTSVSGFRNSDFTNTIQLSNNVQLDNISGFIGSRAPATISLSGNSRLQNFAQGFAFGSYSALTTLNIGSNTLLAACAQPWICTYLRRGGYALISNNAPSCTQPAILQACQALAVQPPVVVPAPAYPNPVVDVLHLSSPSAYTVRDLLGRALRQGQGTQIFMGDLPAGVYVVETGQEVKRSTRTIKQ